MDINKVTRKDLFSMKLRDEPVEIDLTHLEGYGRWAEPHHIKRLRELGVMVDADNGAALITHDIVSIMMDAGAVWTSDTPAGTYLGK